MRTDEEILARIDVVDGLDLLSTEACDLLSCLSFEAARPWLKDTAPEEGWKVSARDESSVTQEMREYMGFAWDKANNCRGISAGRSIAHMCAWLWLLGMDAAAEQIREYELYGKPQLRAICEHFGWDWRQWDNGRWQNDEYGKDRQAAPEEVPPLATE